MKKLKTIDPQEALLAERLKNTRNCYNREAERGPDKLAAYLAEARRLQPLIVIYALGQSLAGLLSHAGGRHADPGFILYHDLQSWLCRSEPATPESAPYSGQTELLEAIMREEQLKYTHALRETKLWLNALQQNS